MPDFFTLHKKIGQSGGASRWRVCYQRGLPRLVYNQTMQRNTCSVQQCLLPFCVEEYLHHKTMNITILF